MASYLPARTTPGTRAVAAHIFADGDVDTHAGITVPIEWFTRFRAAILVHVSTPDRKFAHWRRRYRAFPYRGCLAKDWRFFSRTTKSASFPGSMEPRSPSSPRYFAPKSVPHRNASIGVIPPWNKAPHFPVRNKCLVADRVRPPVPSHRLRRLVGQLQQP